MNIVALLRNHISKHDVIRTYTVGIDTKGIMLYTHSLVEAKKTISDYFGPYGENASDKDKVYIQVSEIDVGTYLS